MIVAEILTHNFSPYGLVDATNVLKEEQNFFLMVCNLNNPTVIVYNAVEELVDSVRAGNVPKTQAQIFSIGVEMIRKTHIFFFLLIRPPWPDSLLIIGWYYSKATTAAIQSLDFVPLLVRLMCYASPSTDGSGTPSLPPPISPPSSLSTPIFLRVYLSLLLFPPLRPFVVMTSSH